MPDHTVEILAGIACTAEEAALAHFVSATASHMQQGPEQDAVVAEVFAKAFAIGLMKAAVGLLRDAGLSLSEAEQILGAAIRCEVFETSGGAA